MLIGLLGGGQLARMLALAGLPMGLRFRVMDHALECCAADVAEFVRGEFADLASVERFAAGLHAASFDFENVPAEALRCLAKHVVVRPGAEVLAMSQDRVLEKQAFGALGVAIGDFMPVDSLADLEQAYQRFNGRVVLKTRRMGYDGKGQVRIDDGSALPECLAALGGKQLIAEAFVPFERELSQVCTRGHDGAMVFYPLVENVHIDGVLAMTLAPAQVSPELEAQARTAARRVAEAYGYVGTLAIEFFQRDGRLLVNEMAPRVHNSGHWSIEGACTSQFENHLRAVMGWSLGDASARRPAAMLNFLGVMPSVERVLGLGLADLHWHDYGKSPRPGRKLGHVTLLAQERQALVQALPTLATTCDLGHWLPALNAALTRFC